MLFKIRPYKFGDEEAIVKLWNKCLPLDPISAQKFKRKVLQDPNFDSKGRLVAENEQGLLGFILAVTRKVPNPSLGLQEDLGWISVIFVHPEHRRKGIGKALLDQALSFLRDEGKKTVWISGYAPNYFWLGIDVEMYANALHFFKAQDFVVSHEAVTLTRVLDNFDIPCGIHKIERNLRVVEGIVIQQYEKRHKQGLLSFLSKDPDAKGWYKDLKAYFERGITTRIMEIAYLLIKYRKIKRPASILVAIKGNEIVGYCQYQPFGIRGTFGPILVREDLRKKGIGTVLLFRSLNELRKMCHAVTVNVWYVTADWAWRVRFYERAGLKVKRRYAVFKKI